MAFTEAQQNILDKARRRLEGTTDEAERGQSRFTERQQAILDAAQARVGSGAPAPTDDVGFGRGMANSVVQGGSALRNIPDVVLAEKFAALADARAAQEAREAERARTGERPGLLERIATYRPSWAAPLESPDELRGLAAGLAQGAAQRSVDVQENYPASQAGQQAVEEVLSAGGFAEGLGTVLRNPLAVAAGTTQIVSQQAPTIGAAALATAVTKNPSIGVGLFAGSGYTQERFGQLVPQASKEGYNLLDDQGALDAVTDTEFMRDQATRGATRGVIIGAVDLLTAGLASKAPLTKASLARQTGIQVVGGGSGEAAAQLATDGEIQAGEVIIEALAEGVSAPVDVAAFALSRPNSQGSDINTEQALQEAEEDAALDLQAQQEAEVEEVRAQAEAETTGRIRRTAAETFTPRKKFVADRLKVISQSLEADIRNPQTELGQAFEASINEQGIFDPADVGAEAKVFLKGYQKETKEATEAQIAQEYVAALDSHAEAVARGEVPTPQVDPAVEGDTATDAAPQENVAAPAKKPTKKEQLRADAVEQLGPDFEVDHPELSQLLSDGKGIYSRGKGKPSRFESMLAKTVAEQNAEAQPATPLAEQAPTVAEQATTPAAQENTATPPVVAQEQPAAETLSGMDANAESYAKSKLGDNWRDTNPALVELLNGRRYAGFQTNVDRVAAETPAVTTPEVSEARGTPASTSTESEAQSVAQSVAQQIIDADPTPKEARNQKSFKESYAAKGGSSRGLFENPNLKEAAQMADWLGSLSQAQWDKINPAFSNNLNPFKNPASIDYKADRAKLEAVLDAPAATDAPTPATAEPAAEIAAVFTQALPNDVKLSANEQKVFDTMQQAFANNEQDDIIQSDGTLNPQRIADRGGMNSRQAAQTALTRLRPKLARAYGLSQEQIKQRLAETKNKSTPDAEFDVNAPTNEVDLAELGSSMGTVASANQGARDGMDGADVAYMEARSEEVDQYANKRQEIADKTRNNQRVSMVKAHGRDAVAAWKNGVSEGGPRVNQLGKADLLEWISAVQEHTEGIIDDAQLAQDLRDIENKYDQNNAGPTLEDTNAGQTTEGTAAQATNDAGPSAGDAPSASSGNQAEQVGTTDTGPSGRSSQESNAGVIGGVETTPVVEVKKRKKITRPKTTPPKFSIGDAEAAASGTTPVTYATRLSGLSAKM